jgi:protein-tyrosine kinase
MEHIRQALERVRGNSSPGNPQSQSLGSDRQAPCGPLETGDAEVECCAALDTTHLEAHRIVTHDDGDRRSNSFHILRTQVVQEMGPKGQQFLAVASPTSNCGRTATAINLALSMARQPGRSIVLVDLNLSKPKIANCLGLHCDRGLVSTLSGRTTLSEAVISVTVGKYRLLTLPCEAAMPNSSEWLGSRAMSSILQELKASYRSSIVIFDLPPILGSDDAISVLPHMDCALFVTAVGVSTLSEVKTCDEYLRSTQVVRIVVNKASLTSLNAR